MTIEDIRKRWARIPPKLYVPTDEGPPFHHETEWEGVAAYDYSRPREENDPQATTVSDRPDRDGWRTDGGCPGYGLPRPVAEALAAAPEDIAYLLRAVECLAQMYRDDVCSPFSVEELVAAALTPPELERESSERDPEEE